MKDRRADAQPVEFKPAKQDASRTSVKDVTGVTRRERAARWTRSALARSRIAARKYQFVAVLERQLEFLRRALDLAERYDFIVASDECYADIYLDEAAPPHGLLEAAEAAGRTHFERCVVFHSLSKRSSLPGLRSGFVAGDPAILKIGRAHV